MPVPALRKILLLVVLFAAFAPAGSARAQDAVQPPPPQTLEAGWQFRFDPADEGYKAGWKTGAWDQQWTDVTVPHVFNPTPVDSEFLGTIGWYRMKLRTPATPAVYEAKKLFSETPLYPVG